MQYIDSGLRDATQTVGAWLRGIPPASVSELRFQSGFFGEQGIFLLRVILKDLRERDALTRGLIGSNDSRTGEKDVTSLANAIGIPRPGASLGICAFSNSFFNPKVLHFTLLNGEQTAYVGSANLTGQGVHGLHVEAGMLLSTAEGDSKATLQRIASAIDG